jgi:phage terminase large subunit
VGRTLQIPTPRVFEPLLQPARYKGAFGGRGSAKSHTFAEMLVERALIRPGMRAVCVREVQKSLEQSVKRLLEDKIAHFGLSNAFRVLDTHIETPGGGIVIFQGMQNHTADSIMSLEGYDVAWVEEAQALSQRSLDLLRPTLRVADSELWFSWNPRSPRDPVDAFLRAPALPPGAVVVRANYDDNPWFPDVLRDEMEWDRAHDPEKYAHIWLGEYERRSESRVFKNWTVEEFDTPKDATFYLGADWGFARDPTVLVRCWIKGRTLHVDWEEYKVGCQIEDTPALFDRLGCAICAAGLPCSGDTEDGHGLARLWPVAADSARPETIAHLQRHGYPRMFAAKKGPGSIEEGVTFLQTYDIKVHPRCKHTADELTLYSYKTDPATGQVLPLLEDKQNHVIDALRYAVEAVRRSGKVEFVNIPWAG